MPASAAIVETVEFVIQGVTGDGKPFRPGDRAERLCVVVGERAEDLGPMARMQRAGDTE